MLYMMIKMSFILNVIEAIAPIPKVAHILDPNPSATARTGNRALTEVVQRIMKRVGNLKWRKKVKKGRKKERIITEYQRHRNTTRSILPPPWN